MWKQYKGKLILLIAAGILLVAAGVYAGFKLGATDRGPSSMLDPNAVTIDGEGIEPITLIGPGAGGAATGFFP